MSTAKFIEVHVEDVVRLRKPHACGGTDWTVVRLGADIGLRCDRCQHRILLARSVFERRLKAFLSRAVTGESFGIGQSAGTIESDSESLGHAIGEGASETIGEGTGDSGLGREND